MHGQTQIKTNIFGSEKESKPKYLLPRPISINSVYTWQFLWLRNISGRVSGRGFKYREINPSWSSDFLVKTKIIY